jgi:SAM-dependent methyltransferase
MKESFKLNNISKDVEHIRNRVRDAYSSAADNPTDKHRFPVGRWFAESIGYSKDILDNIPDVAIESFAGVSNVPVFAEIPEGATVLDIGCGAGLDCLISAQKTGPKGKVIGVDFSESMLKRAQLAAAEAGYNNIEFHCADAENLPVDNASIDIVLANGIFNLTPKRDKIFSEISRVLHPEGAVYSAELILTEEPQDEKMVCDLKDWLS